MPGQNDVLLRDARCDQFVGHGAVRPVVLNPHLVTDDVDVDDRAVNALDPVPAEVQEFEMVALRIHDQFGIDLAICRPVASVFREDLTNDLAVTGQPIHCTILPCFSSKPTKRPCAGPMAGSSPSAPLRPGAGRVQPAESWKERTSHGLTPRSMSR